MGEARRRAEYRRQHAGQSPTDAEYLAEVNAALAAIWTEGAHAFGAVFIDPANIDATVEQARAGDRLALQALEAVRHIHEQGTPPDCWICGGRERLAGVLLVCADPAVSTTGITGVVCRRCSDRQGGDNVAITRAALEFLRDRACPSALILEVHTRGGRA